MNASLATVIGMMDSLRNLKTSEARAMLQLVNQLHETHDPVSRKHVLLAGICEMIGGSAGSCVVADKNHATGKRTIASATEYCRPEAPEARIEIRWPQNMPDVGPDRIADLHRKLDSILHFPNSTMSATLSVYRSASQGGRFAVRDRAIVHFFHAEVMLLTSPNARSLAPRARETLEHLLAGLSEKQIASKLRLSPNTVHHYVKSIHRHFGVSSRSELLARWVGK
jgi:DNA-binding CsgD family transcriptional regulator